METQKTPVIERVSEVTPEIVEAFTNLIPQVSSRKTLPDRQELEAMVSNPLLYLFVARLEEHGPIIGSLSLVIFSIPSGKRSSLQDIVVDTSARGRGIASFLLEKAIEVARSEGVRTIDMTSRIEREGSNRLYQHLGFEKRDTNVYRITLT